MSKKQKKKLIRIIISFLLFIALVLIEKIVGFSAFYIPLVLYLLIYLFIGHDVLIEAFENIIKGHIFDENFLMIIASIACFALGIIQGIKQEGELSFDEAVAIIIFFQLGELFESISISSSRKSISTLVQIRPDSARKEDGTICDPSSIQIDEIIVVYPGEKIPLDGIIISGSSTLDTKILTGESLPVEVNEGENVLSGSINLTSTLKIKVTVTNDTSTISRILNLIENASMNKAKVENFISRFSALYTPIVCALALLLFLIGSLISKNFMLYGYRALQFLVISCPCALVISIPMAMFISIGQAAKKGVLIKGSNYLEMLSRIDTYAFDKTGTITKGNVSISFTSSNEALKYAAIAEQESTHPIALAIKEKYTDSIDKNYTIINKSGFGIVAKNDKNTIIVGNCKLMSEYNIVCDNSLEGTIVHVALNTKYLGYLVVEDTIKENAIKFINYLKSINKKSCMLTGDSENVAKKVAKECNIDKYYSSLLPEDKLNILKSLEGKTAFIGDGINDAPSLISADLGVAMGKIGADAAIESSDIVILNDNLDSLIFATKLSKKTMNIVTINIVFALAIKLIIMILSMLGISNMYLAIFGDVGVSILAILNALRLKLYMPKS